MEMTPLDSSLIESPSGLGAHLGYKLTHWGPDHARLELPLKPELMNRAGIPHGGIYATLLDTAMGLAGAYTGNLDDRQLVLTLSMTVNFMSRPKGKLLIAEGFKTGGGRRTYFAEATILDETGEKIARGTGAFKYRSGA